MHQVVGAVIDFDHKALQNKQLKNMGSAIDAHKIVLGSGIKVENGTEILDSTNKLVAPYDANAPVGTSAIPALGVAA